MDSAKYEVNKYDLSFDQYSLSASALNIPMPNSAPLPPSNLPPTPTSAKHPQHQQQHHQHPHHHHQHHQHPTPLTTFTSAQLPLMSTHHHTQHAQAQPEFIRRSSYPEPPRGPHHHLAGPPHHLASGPSSPVYSPPGLSMSTSVSAQSDIVSPSATTLPSPPRRTSEFASPLEEMPEFANTVIPPLCPPSVDRGEYDDWDNLPELLRQEPRADFTPRRPMNAYFIYMKLRRAQFANANPTFSTGELSKLLGKEWSSMGVEKKAPWNELYERLMKAFKAKFPEYQYERGGKRNKKRRSRSAPNSPTALLIRGEPQRGSMMTPRYAPYHLPPQHYAVYPPHAHAYPVQQMHYRQEQQVWAPPPQQYATYAPVNHQPTSAPGMIEMQPMVMPAEPMHPQAYGGWTAAPEALPAPAPSYPAEPQWDEYIHH